MIGIARPQRAPDGPRQMKRERRHVEPKADLRGRRIEEIGHGLSRIGKRGVGLGTGRKTPVRVGIAVKQVIGHGLDHRRGNLRSARPIKIGDLMTIMDASQCREDGTDCSVEATENAAVGSWKESCRHLQGR